MSLSPISKRKLERITSGKVKLQGRSTFEQPSPEEARKDMIRHKQAVALALRGSKEAMKKLRFGKSRYGDTSRSTAMKLADKWFSEFIRLRDAGPDGRVKCVTCSHTDHWRLLQCGHFVTRGNQSTRYDEQNSTVQCRGCNYNGGKVLQHETAIEARYGTGTAEALRQKGRMRCKRTVNDFLFLADCYRKKVEWIREHEPAKFNRAA